MGPGMKRRTLEHPDVYRQSLLNGFATCARACPVARSCPIPREQRGDGGIVTKPQADHAARALAVLEGQRKALISQLKAWSEDPNNATPMVNDHEFAGWNPPVGRGRKYGVWDVSAVKEPQP
jgi:hypothetical protein